MQMKKCPHDSFSNKLQHIIIQAFEKYPEPIHVCTYLDIDIMY